MKGFALLTEPRQTCERQETNTEKKIVFEPHSKDIKCDADTLARERQKANLNLDRWRELA